MTLVLFDCDGTLVDSAALICAAMDDTFRSIGLAAPDTRATRGIIGRSLDLAIAELLPHDLDVELPQLVDLYKQHYLLLRSSGAHPEAPYRGIAELIGILAARDDIVIGMVTGKSRRGVASHFESYGWGPHFATVRTADDCPSKPHPAMVLECCDEVAIPPSRTIVVGDTIYDMEMATSAGATAIGVDWGYGEPGALRRAGAVAVLSRPDELLSHLTKDEDA